MELASMFGWLCTISSLCFQLVGMQICYGIVKKGSTGDMSPFTFISYFVACAVWLKYGLLQNLRVVIAVNGNGSVLNFIYTIICYRYSTKKVQHNLCTKTMGPSQFHRFMFIGSMMLICPLLYIRYFEINHQVALENLGSYCVCLTIISYGAPLVSLLDVIRSRSTESLSFVLIVANFLVAVLWAIYGGLINDRYVQRLLQCPHPKPSTVSRNSQENGKACISTLHQAPNFLGAVLALIQLSLFAIYPSSPMPKSKVIHS